MIVPPSEGQQVWIDGDFVPWRDARVHVTAHHYGVGVFEGVRAYQGEQGTAIFRLRDHTDRLFRSAHILNIPIPEAYDKECLNRVQRELVRRNGFRSAYIRPFVFFDGAMGLGLDLRPLTVRVAVVALAWSEESAYSGVGRAAEGITARTSTFTRHHANTLLSKAKANGNYMNSILALAEARGAGANEAILLDQDGLVTEASGANLFLVKKGALHTPPGSAVLEGITRDTIFALARDLDVPVVERSITRDELYVADEVLLTGTAAEVTPVRSVDGRRVGAGTPGRLTVTLQRLYQQHVLGKSERHGDWLTWIVEEDEGHG